MAYPLTEDEFRAIYAKVPRLCVDLIIRDSQNRILLAKRGIAPFKDLWHIPGGTVYFGETIAQAAKRVATEELGLDVNPGKILDALTASDEYKDDWHGWPIAVEVEAAIVFGKPRADENSRAIGFFAQLPQPMVAVQRRFLIDQLGYQEEVAEK